jgi:hypothetical protein
MMNLMVIAKKGNRKVVGVGIVRDGCRHEPARQEYKNVRAAHWVREGEWALPDGESFATKRLSTQSAGLVIAR